MALFSGLLSAARKTPIAKSIFGAKVAPVAKKLTSQRVGNTVAPKAQARATIVAPITRPNATTPRAANTGYSSMLSPSATLNQPTSNYQNIIEQSVNRTADDFEKQYGKFESFFDPDRTMSGERARAERYYLPQLQRQIEGIDEDYANRGLLRSGLRGQSQELANQDAFEQIDTMIQSQAAAREQEAREGYNEQLQRFLADTTVGGYQVPQGFIPQVTYEGNFDAPELTTDPNASFGRGFTDLRNKSLNTKYRVGLGGTIPQGGFSSIL